MAITYLIPKIVKVQITGLPLSAEEAGLSVIGDWQYPRYSLLMSAYQPFQVFGDWQYPGYSAIGTVTDGAPYKPPVYFESIPEVVKISAFPLEAEPVRLSQPIAGQWDYPRYGVIGRVEFVGVGVGAWDYLGYSADGVLQQNGAVFGDWEYPQYDAFGGSISVEGILYYPQYSTDGLVSAGTIGDWEYRRYEFEGSVVKVPDNAVDAAFIYPPYQAEAVVVQQISGVLVANYWSYTLAGQIGIQYGSGDWDYPGYSLEGVAAPNGAVFGDWEYPTYEASGSVEEYGFRGELNYPTYGVDGFIGFPGVGVGIWNYPVYSLRGVIGDKVGGRRRRQFMVIRKW